MCSDRKAIADDFGEALLASDAFLSQMVAIPIPRSDAAALHDALLNEDAIEVPVIDWNGHTFVRVSVQGYNSQEEMARLAAALHRRFGRRS